MSRPETLLQKQGRLLRCALSLWRLPLFACTHPLRFSATPAMAYSAQPGFAVCKQCVRYSMCWSPAVCAGEYIAVGAIIALLAQAVAAATPRRRTIDLE